MNSWAMATHRLPLRVPRPRASTGYGSVMSLEPPRLEASDKVAFSGARWTNHVSTNGVTASDPV